jgi:hypothetical protein
MYSKIKTIESRYDLNNGILSYNSFYGTQYISGFFSPASKRRWLAFARWRNSMEYSHACQKNGLRYF